MFYTCPIVGAFREQPDGTYTSRIVIESDNYGVEYIMDPPYPVEHRVIPHDKTFFHQLVVKDLPANTFTRVELRSDDVVEECRLQTPGSRLQLFMVSCDGYNQYPGYLFDEAKFHQTEPRRSMWERLYEEANLVANDSFCQFVHCGNQVYLDKAIVSALSTFGEKQLSVEEQWAVSELCKTVYRETFGAPFTRQCLSKFSHVMILNEHDVIDNQSDKILWPGKQISPEIVSTCLDLYNLYQHLLVGRPDEDPEDGFRWSLSVGGVRLVAPDLRSFSSPDQLMGERQFTWLEQEIQDNTILVLSAPLFASVGIQDSRPVQWTETEARLAERDRLLELLATKHVAIVSGEARQSGLFHMSRDAKVIPYLLASPISSYPRTRALKRTSSCLSCFSTTEKVPDQTVGTFQVKEMNCVGDYSFVVLQVHPEFARSCAVIHSYLRMQPLVRALF